MPTNAVNQNTKIDTFPRTHTPVVNQTRNCTKIGSLIGFHSHNFAFINNWFGVHFFFFYFSFCFCFFIPFHQMDWQKCQTSIYNVFVFVTIYIQWLTVLVVVNATAMNPYLCLHLPRCTSVCVCACVNSGTKCVSDSVIDPVLVCVCTLFNLFTSNTFDFCLDLFLHFVVLSKFWIWNQFYSPLEWNSSRERILWEDFFRNSSLKLKIKMI